MCLTVHPNAQSTAKVAGCLHRAATAEDQGSHETPMGSDGASAFAGKYAGAAHWSKLIPMWLQIWSRAVWLGMLLAMGCYRASRNQKSSDVACYWLIFCHT